MRTRWKPRPRYEDTLKYKYNEYIRSPEVAIIDENGLKLEAMPTPQALALARQRGYDLVEVNPNATPPIAKLLNYGQFQYEQQKQQQVARAKQKKVEEKGIRLSFKMGTGDLEVRRNQTEKFLREGHRVRIEMMLRGREKGHTDLAYKNVQQFVESVSIPHTTDQPLGRQGSTLSIVIRPE